MGPLLVLVSPCFRENVIVTCKMESFLCSLDNYLLKNVTVFFFGYQISKWRSFEKKAVFTYFSHFLVTREILKNSFSTYGILLHTYTYFAFYHVWFLFGATPGVDSYLRHFRTINK